MAGIIKVSNKNERSVIIQMKLPSVYGSLDYESSRLLKKYRKRLSKINAVKDFLRQQSDADLHQVYEDWLNEIGTFDYKKPKHVNMAIALAREVTYRLTGKFQYDVQVLGALAATERNMVQMSTGSGKTLTLILPVVVFGLMHKGVNVLTVNDYLSERDWNETKPIYDWFNLTSAYTSNDEADQVQREAFECDITYSTNSTLGFAYLNSELASDIGKDIKIIHRPLFAALVDEADEILMDDARNPLIIASADDVASKFDAITVDGKTLSIQEIVDKIKTISDLDYDEDAGKIFLNEWALKEIQNKLDLTDEMLKDARLMHIIYSAVNAIFQYHAFTDYIVQDEPDEDTGSQVVLIDKATGRLAKGRTMSDDMHAFIEMKEGVFSGKSTKSSIQVTYQVLFNLFETFSGLSGTLGTSYKEFIDIYKTGVVVIPDRFPNQLKQLTHVYMNQTALYEDMIKKVQLYLAAHHPVLIGATSDIGVEMISAQLRAAGIKHQTLVSTDTDETKVVEEVGKPGSVVVTTDIMGRGTDIHVEDVQGERGLVVFQIGNRPNSRVERQFAGRAARQGQPGRYHRMLTVSALDDIGVQPDEIEEFMQYSRSNRKLVNHYNEDVLLNGRNPDYAEYVEIIDKALEARESAESANRVQEFRAYSITDVIQISLLSRLDGYREILKESVDKVDGGDERLQKLAAHMMLDEKHMTKRQIKKVLPQKLLEVEAVGIDDLQQYVFKHIADIIDNLIPEMRKFSEGAIDTTKLAGQVKYDQTPENMMMRLIGEFLSTHKDEMILKIS